MEKDEIPKGLLKTQIILFSPLISLTGVLCMMAPMATNPAFVDPL